MVEPASVRLSRLIVPVAAAAAAATYVALMRDQRQARRRRGPVLPAVPAVEDPAPRAMQPPVVTAPTFVQQHPPASAESLSHLTSGEQVPTSPGEPSPSDVREGENTQPLDSTGDVAEAAQKPTPDDGPVLDEGSFSLGGWAAAPGHTVVSAVTYRQRLPFEVAPDHILLSIEHSENVPDDGLVVLADPGFAPDREGFTLVLAAADPGPFSVSGTYRAIA